MLASRPVPQPAQTRYARYVGRVGALAVALGIGIAVANSATAYADSDGDSSSSGATSSGATSSTSTADAGPVKPASNRSSAPTAGSATDAPRDTDDSGEAADSADDDEASDRSARFSAAEDDNAESVADDDDEVLADVEPAVEPEVALDDEETPSAPVPGAPQKPAAPARSGPAAVPEPATVTAEDAAAEQGTATVPVFNAVVSNVVAPLVDPALPAPSPVGDAVLAWVRRLITHTFFNKTPVLLKPVETEQIITGQVLITLDVEDPNGDPLTFDIVQPANGLVVRVPATNTFLFTPTLPVLGDPMPVKFDIVVRDDSEHLTGVLGSIQKLLHSVARFFRLAQPDNRTVTVEFDAEPIVQAPPTLAVVGRLLPYVLGGDPVDVLTLATIVDLDSPRMNEATVTIGLGRQAGDKLGYVAPDGVQIDVEQVDDYTLRFSGLAGQADYQAALQAVTFSTTDLGLVARTVEFTITDEHGVPNLVPALALVTVLGLPLAAPPTLLAAGGLPYFLGGAPVRLLSVAEITDLDSASLQRVLVKMTPLTAVAGDKLGYVAPAGISVGVNQIDDRTIELTGVHSLADYETALKAITFSATSLGLVARTVEITLTDADGVDSLLPTPVAMTVLPGLGVELPLLVTPVGLPVHTLGKPPVKLLTSVAIANADDGKLTGAVVTIGLNRVAGDKLGYTAVPGNPVGVVQTNDWTLTLSGEATVEQYQQALQNITFSATQMGLPRTVTIDVTEADGDTSPAPGIVFASSLVPLPPTIVVTAVPPTHTIGKPGVALAPVVTIEDLDSPVLAGATVALGVGRQTGDTLSYTTPPGGTITAIWNGTDTLTLSGAATVAQYEAALEAVLFAATGGAGVPRTVTINVIDDSGLSALVPGAAAALVKNPDRPTVVTVGLPDLSFPKVGATVKPITLATIADTDSTTLTGASIRIAERFTTGDTLGYTPISGVPITASYNTATGELILTGTATIAQYKQALESVTFRATQYGGGLLDALGVTRVLSVFVTDDSGVSNTLPGVVPVTVFR
ncbi:hypothetical protein MPNTM1_02221 [Mycolicibacterium parafortuitum]|uniref:hypothetical protein n=1 Tax=Mycolicibacterium parafortuitum TaxID=39692 RepID=UPI0032C4A5DF